MFPTFAKFQSHTLVEEAIKHLTSTELLQPLLMKYGETTWVKLDHWAMPVNASCIADCMEFLVMIHHVINVKYVHELTLVYGLFEINYGSPAINKIQDEAGRILS